MANAFIVMGGTGEYADRASWPVTIYRDHRRAYAHAKRANAWAVDNKVHRSSPGVRASYYGGRVSELKSPEDDRLPYIDYTGISYGVAKVKDGDA